MSFYASTPNSVLETDILHMQNYGLKQWFNPDKKEYKSMIEKSKYSKESERIFRKLAVGSVITLCLERTL